MANWSTRFRHLAAAFAAACVVLGGTSAEAAPWQPSEDDQLLLELRSGQYRLGDNLRGYQTPSGVCVDFADLIQALDLPVRLDKKSRRATGWLFAEDQRFILDREANTVQTMNGARAIGATAIVDTPEGWCMDLGALSTWLGVQFAPDLGNLAIVIKSDKKLPFLEGIERKSRAARLRTPGLGEFDLAKMPQADVPYRDWRTPSVDVQVQTQWSRSGGTQVHYEALASGEVIDMSFTARLTGSKFGIPDSLRFTLYRNDPDGGLLGGLHATQLAYGDVSTERGALTGQGAYGRGAFVSNRPLNLPARFGVTTLRGALPSGWDAELYRNGELRAYQPDRGDGRYEFADIELLFGQNDFEVVLYGPQGQIRHERSSVPVGAEAIPAGKTWFWAGILQDGHDLIDFTDKFTTPQTGWRWGVGVERGLNKRTSVGVEYQSLMLDGHRQDYLEATLRRSFGGLLLETSAAQQFGAGRALRAEALGRVGTVRFDAQVLWVDGNFDSELVKAQQSHEYSLRLNVPVRVGSWSLPLEGGVRQVRTRDGREVTEWLMRGALHINRVSLSAELMYRTVGGPNAASGADNPGTVLTIMGNSSIGRVRLRGSAKFRLSGAVGGTERRGFEQGQFVVEAPLGPRSTLRAGYEFDAPAARHEFTLGYVHQFDRFALRADGRADTAGRLSFSLTAAFSFGPDPVDGGWRTSRDRLAENGQAAITVFRDENGDGYQQPGEETVEGVTVEAGYRHSDKPTNADGRAVIDGLQPYVPVLVSIDTGSLPDPLLQPKGRGMVVVPRPGVQASLSLPLAPTGEIEAILLGPDGEPRGGVTVELTDTAGRVILRGLSDFDGYVLFDTVPYGDYRLQIGSASATALGVRQPVASTLRIDRANPSLRLGRIRPELAPQTQQAANSAP
ncbi:carboxypeptidase regulatory-like domain-containing protein [Novosphingobium sp.]|uniref:carboxypeptidase regulatory-like domain-containing protein n=1 Tax=Novosphingobium sp. TaxID=1874826 RepID=UPI0035B41521